MSLSTRRSESFGRHSRPLEPSELPLDGTLPPAEPRRYLRPDARRDEVVLDASFSGAVFMALCAAGLLALLGLVLVALAVGAISGTLVV